MLKERLGYKFITIFDRIKSHSKESMAELDIAHGCFITLLYISENEGITQAKLAELQRKDRNVIGRNIDVLEEKGFVERRRGKEDRRSFTLFLTEKGKRFAEDNVNILVESERNVLKNLTNDEINTLYELLNKII